MISRDGRILVPFPHPGAEIQLAHRELFLATEGTVQQRRELGDPAELPRPWDPSTCHDPGLRRAVWDWLADVVSWLNLEHTWDVAAAVPGCWNQHPHLVRDLAVLADQRRAAALATTSGPLEEWQRYALPAFVTRMRDAVQAHCDADHQTWPGQRAFEAAGGRDAVDQLEARFESDVTADVGVGVGAALPRGKPIGIIDLETGELAN